MLATFKYQSDLYRALGTNAVMWKKITVGEGASYKLVSNILLTFLNILRQQNELGFPGDKGIQGLLAARKFRIYSECIISAECDSLMVELPFNGLSSDSAE